MGYEYEDYYDESSEADVILSEATKELKELIKGSIKEHIDSIEDRERVLEEEWKKIRKSGNELRDKEWTINAKYDDMEKAFKDKKLKELVEMVFDKCDTEFFKVTSKSVKREKCTYCDSERKCIAKLPDGTETKVKCSCTATGIIYEVEKIPILHIKIYKNNKDINCYFEYNNSYDSYANTLKEDKIRHTFNINDNPEEYYGLFYTTKEEAQKHADYKNSTIK